jgi:zinc D-Ala-D-Ala dipeptidase
VSPLLAIALACAAPPAPATPSPPAPPPPPPVEAPAPAPAPVPAPVVVDGRAPPPDGFVDLAAHVPGLRLAIGYATPDNFVGSVLPGYGAANAWLRTAPADGLRCAQEKLAPQGFGLQVRDGYRPLRATRAMVAWAHRTGQVHLLDDGYVSRYSGHNRGNTVDLELVRLADGAAVDHGTPWDTLSEASHTRNATGEALANRLVLKAAMEACGYRNYWKEWWHYTFAEAGEKELPHRDVPYACAEPAEGAWTDPKDWKTPGYVPPPPPPPARCPG